MDVRWDALGEVAVAGFAVGVAIVVLFAVGVLAWSTGARLRGEDPDGPARGGPLANAGAGLCFLACALIAGYGLYLIIPRFH